MAVDIKYYPEDVGKDYGSLAIKFPMNAAGNSSSGGLFNMSYTTEDQAISNYINLLLTRRGERYMQPTYGIGIQEKIFEFNSKVVRAQLKTEIMQESRRWLPYIINHEIVVDNRNKDGIVNEHNVEIRIKFSVTESGANRTIVIFRDNGVTNVQVT